MIYIYIYFGRGKKNNLFIPWPLTNQPIWSKYTWMVELVHMYLDRTSILTQSEYTFEYAYSVRTVRVLILSRTYTCSIVEMKYSILVLIMGYTQYRTASAYNLSNSFSTRFETHTFSSLETIHTCKPMSDGNLLSTTKCMNAWNSVSFYWFQIRNLWFKVYFWDLLTVLAAVEPNRHWMDFFLIFYIFAKEISMSNIDSKICQCLKQLHKRMLCLSFLWMYKCLLKNTKSASLLDKISEMLSVKTIQRSYLWGSKSDIVIFSFIKKYYSSL